MRKLIFLFLGTCCLSYVQAQETQEPPVLSIQIQFYYTPDSSETIKLEDFTSELTQDSIQSVTCIYGGEPINLTGYFIIMPARGDALFMDFKSNADLANAFRKLKKEAPTKGTRLMFDKMKSKDGKTKYPRIYHVF